MSERDVPGNGGDDTGNTPGETADGRPANGAERNEALESATDVLDLAAGEQLLVSPPGQKFDYGRLPERSFGNLLVLSVGRNPGQIGRALDRLGVNQQSVGVVPVTGSSLSYDGALWTSNRVSPMDLTGISIEFTRGFEQLQSGEGWVLVDSVSILLMYAEFDRVYRLLDSIVGACRRKNVRGVYVVDTEALTSETMDHLTALFDRTVRL